MKCPRCQADNRDAARFCRECGATFATGCPSCGARVAAGSKFCDSCGAALAVAPVPTAEASRFASPESYTPKHLAERILTSKSALEGERKQVTVLFADLKGSMELFAERDPEEARKILDPVLERMMEAVHRFEGTVNQVMGDGIMALFGAPLAHEDHAVRACYAALRMQESVKEHSEHVRRELGVPVSIRVGLNSGEVVVRAIGNDLHMDYTAVGQTTHLAARMEQAALPGSILIAPDTLLLAEGYVEVRRLGPVAIKGLDQPVEVHEVTGVGVARTRLQASAARGFTRFVGRDGELAHLRRALGRAAEGHGQVVAVVGEAGVGKSRLLYEFTHSHRLEGWLVLEASSVSYGKASGYLPVVDLLKTYFKIQDRDDHRGIREKITGKVLTLDETLRPTLPALLALLDVPLDDAQWQSLDPSQRRHRTLDGVKRLLLRESQLQPLLLVFEDLHWIDAETQGLLDTLVDSVPSARVLLLVNFRPGYQHSWSGKTYYSQLRLDTLPSESTAELLEALLGRDPGLEPLKQLLLRRGNPFFLEEIVRTLAETRVLAGERGAYRLIRPIRSLQVPATVQAILATRIDRLPVAEKQLLQTAAVIGKDVPFGVLEAISRPDEDVGRGLASLQAAEFLYEARLFPDLEYTFKHALTHEVVYASLLAERRRTLHARIVEAIERLYPDRLAERTEELAHHALRGEVWEKALAYLRDAGARALARAANGAAVALFDQALAVLPRLPTSDVTQGQAIDLRLDLRAALMLLGEFGRTGEVLKEAEELAAKLDDRPRRGRIAGALANLCWEMGDQDRAMAAGQRALEIATTVGDGALRDLADRYLGRCYYALGDYPRAIETLKRVVERRRADSPGRTVSLSPHVFLIQCLAETGAFAEGTSYGEEALRFAEVTDQAISLTAACTAVGRLYLRQGKVEKSIAVLERGLEMCQVVNLPVIFPTAASPLGAAYALAGRSTEALPLLEQAVERATAMRRMVDQSLWVAWLSEGLLWVGRVEEATDLAARALELAQTCGERANRAWILWLLGEIHAHGDARDFERSADDYRRALAEADELGLRPLRAHCWLGLGILNEQAGRTEEARTALHRARDLFRDMEMTFWLPETESALRRLGS